MLSSLIASLHAELLRSGHTNGAEVGEDMFPLIFAVFGVFVAHWEDWVELVQYLQQANKPEYQEGCAILCAPRQIYGSCRMLTPKPELLNDLREAGAILEIGVSYSRCRLSFINERVLSWLCDYGAWLELYLYAKIRQSGLTDDVMLDAVLSWDNDADDDDTVNEVDVLALRGNRLYLFSCKAGAVKRAADGGNRGDARISVPRIRDAGGIDGRDVADAGGLDGASHRRTVEMHIWREQSCIALYSHASVR